MSRSLLAVVVGLVALGGAMVGADALAIEGPSPGAVSASTVSLPSGPGSVAGLGPAGEVSPFTGQFSYAIPVDLPPGRAGFGPSMAFAYSGALGSGPLGIGWGFAVPHIARSTRLGVPAYDEADELELVGIGSGGRLVLLESGPYAGEYRVEGHGQSVRVVATAGGFEVTTADGTRYDLYTALEHPDDGVGVYAWYASKITALGGEHAMFAYSEHGGHKRLDRIQWTEVSPNTYAYEVVLSYEDRADRVPSWRAGFEQVVWHRLAGVTMWSYGEVRRVYTLDYDPDSHLSRLVSITTEGGDALALPPVTFSYGSVTSGVEAALAEGTDGWRLEERGVTLQDVNGDGLADLVRYELGNRSWKKNWGGSFGPAEPLPGGDAWDLQQVRLMDLDGDLLAEMVYVANDTWRVYRLGEGTAGPEYAPVGVWPGSTGVALAGPSVVYGDVTGDGQTDLLRPAGTTTWLQRGSEAGLGAPERLGLVSASDGHVELGQPEVQLHDVNGDGLADVVWLGDAYLKVYWGRGDGTFETTTTRYCYPWNWKAGHHDRALGDGGVNGCDETRPEVFDVSRLRLADLDRDGLLDLVRVSGGVVHWWPGRWFVAEDDDELAPWGAPTALARPPGAFYDDVVTIADVNGNGSQDVVWSTAFGLWVLDLAGPATQAMLTEVDHGLGAKTRIVYSTSSWMSLAADAAETPWAERLPMTMALPHEVSVVVPDDEAAQPTVTTRYTVRDGFWDRAERRFGGFLEVAEERLGDTAAATLVTITRFERGDGESRVLRGQPQSVTRADGEGRLFDEVVAVRDALQVDGLPEHPWLRVPVVLVETTHVYEGECTSGVRVLETAFEHDGHGNVVLEERLGDVAVTGDEVVVEYAYVSNETDWVLFKPCDTRTKEADGTVVAWSQTVYEASLTPANPTTGCTGGASDGRPRAVFGWLKDTHCGGTESGRWVKLEETAYDAYGNPTSLLREGVTRTLSYDAAAVFPASETVPCVAVTPIGMTWSVEAWDTTLGLPVRIKEPSGSEHEAVYDSLGRVTELWGTLAAGQFQTLQKLQSFDYDLTGPRPRVTTVVHEGGLAPDVETTAVFTATGAPLFEATRLASDSWIVSGYRHRNGRGLTDRVAMPFEASSIEGVGLGYPTSGPDQTIAYDAQGRAVEQVLPEVPGGPTGGAAKSLAIEPLRVTTLADDLAPVLRRTDGQGRLAEVARDIPPVGQSGFSSVELARVEYDAAGRMVEYDLQAHYGAFYTAATTQLAGATHGFCYDTLGRLVYGTDPDAGLRTYAWDDTGRLIGEENAEGDTLSYGYDCAGRLITRDAVSATDSSLDESFFYGYDQSDFYGGVFTAMVDGQWGRLAYVSSTTDNDWRQHFIYDGQGRVIGLEEQVGSGPGGSGTRYRTSTTTYTPSGQVLEADYGRIHVEHAYDAAGRLSWLGYGVEGGTTALLYEPLELTPAGSPVWERLGNGVGTWFERDVLEQVTAMSVRDTGLTSGSVSAYQAAFASASAGDIRYELDAITRTAYGAATVVVDSATSPGNPRRDAVFAYDGAARLVSATLGETFDGATSQGSYAFAYAYDGLQNLVQREAVSVPTGAAAPRMASGSYQHGGSGYGPRQLAGVPSAGVTMSYDGAGRMVARAGGGFGAAMAYDASDRVRVVALGDDEVRHRYGPTGERNWTGWFEDDVLDREEYRFASGLALRGGRYELVVGLGGSRSLARISVPEVADATHEVTYMHPGVGPGAVTFTDKAGALIEERLHEPFGVALEGPGADYEQEPLGWNAKPVDPWTEWSDHGARWHATDLAHWLSPDPLLRGPDPKLVTEFWRLSPYGFVAGNPIAFWDPDGRCPGTTGPGVSQDLIAHATPTGPGCDPKWEEAPPMVKAAALGVAVGLAAPATASATAVCASNPVLCGKSLEAVTASGLASAAVVNEEPVAAVGAVAFPFAGLAYRYVASGFGARVAAGGGGVAPQGPVAGSFNSFVQQLSEVGQRNVRTLQGWARSKGWVRQPGSGPEVWGVRQADGSFSWRLKIKPEAGTRAGLGAGSQRPRFDARLDAAGTYVNPFTGQTGGKAVGTHLPLEQVWP